ncbi:substrate-binding domain-containing protein [Spirosoma oryzicola]|uniref:substrate-binding domain-containing protein n=1 Tax=Spirosoma oryzicola TaxID=2898794 RepID=UPI001E292D7E|nr:substrate-binding domain-containing protein [Spirosoma oryzicola]UHG89576.1 substrate-binding domain-containing protein [Spirosoma oryzicola]
MNQSNFWLLAFRQVTWAVLVSAVLFFLQLNWGCQSSDKRFRIGFSQRTLTDTWRKSMLASMNQELSFHPDVEFIVKDAQGQSNTQIRQIQELLDQRVDLLIVSPNAAQPITPVVERAYQLGIPVIVLDRRTASDQYTAYVGADNVEVGRTAGQYANALLKGSGNVIEIGESPGSSADIDRHRGFSQILKAHPGLRLIKKLEGDWDRRSFADELTQLIQKTPNVQLIFAQNDRTALKAHQVCQQLGIGQRIKIIGVDGLPGKNEGIDLVDRGILDATVLYPTGGKEAIRTALAILEKQPFRRENRLLTTLVDSTNVRIMKLQNEKVIEQQTDIDRQNRNLENLTKTYTSQQNTLYITFACLIVVLLLGGWALYLFRSKQAAYLTLEKQNEEIRNQKNQIEAMSQQARQATEEKLRFYSYISHEFNTPLSLILIPTEDLLAKKNVGGHELRNNLSLVQKNAYRLLRLVDQMLDLRKTDAGKQRLQASEQDLIAFVRDIIGDFQRKAERQRIDLQLLTSYPKLPVWIDTEKLDKVLFNLLSNAFKYTPKGGLIHVCIDVVAGQARIQVIDNGEGMTPDEKHHAFDLFYSGSQPFNLAKGIGLAMSQEFIQLHRGDIDVVSEKGRGTTFTILLPIGSEHLDETERTGLVSRYRPFIEAEVATEEPPMPLSAGRSAGTLLIIEDNDDLRTFLVNRLGAEFDVIAETTAEAGWERILETIPDLILSDIMLPGMDGMQLTQRIKTDWRTSHIPVVLLTAKNQMEQQIEGTRAGADLYLTKPFNSTYLLETLRTTLANRRKQQQRFATDSLPSGENKQDRKFLNDLTALIEKNIGDSTFGVEKLSREMGVSRVQLYRKVQALLDKNVMDYLTEIRLKKAKQLLRDSAKTMSEIAEQTGFSSPTYFTTFFKQHTGKTPSEYRRSQVNA